MLCNGTVRSTKEAKLTEQEDHLRRKAVSGSKSRPNDREGGDIVQQAQEWGGGSKGSKGPVTAKDKHNQNSSAMS